MLQKIVAAGWQIGDKMHQEGCRFTAPRMTTMSCLPFENTVPEATELDSVCPADSTQGFMRVTLNFSPRLSVCYEHGAWVWSGGYGWSWWSLCIQPSTLGSGLGKNPKKLVSSRPHISQKRYNPFCGRFFARWVMY